MSEKKSIICPVCGAVKHHTVYCGIYEESICQTHCRGCQFRDNSCSLSHCTYREECKNGLHKM